MKILNISGYQFSRLSERESLRFSLLEKCNSLSLKGTILLSEEGININLAGFPSDIESFKKFFLADDRFNQMTFRESYSDFQPFRRIKVKLRKEIITFRRPEVQADKMQAPHISPQEFKQWLDENRDVVVLDTRNDFEVQFGTFEKAVNLQLKDFCEFPKAAKKLSREKPIVMFCTGGIRCEKAALHLLEEGFTEVYQLRGGILNYFAETGGAHYQGDCFVFDGRVALDAELQVTGAVQCTKCQAPVREQHQC